MMEAKDTMMTAIEYASLIQRLEERKFPETDDELADLLCAACKSVSYAQSIISFKAGVKEVVDWMNENPDYLLSIKGWQAKLKEWGFSND